MQYAWDPAKDALNRRKHGLSLADGIAALEDPVREAWIDNRFDYGEERMITLGATLHGVLYVVTAEAGKRTGSESSPSEGQRNMRSNDMVRVEHNPGDPPIETETDYGMRSTPSPTSRFLRLPSPIRMHSRVLRGRRRRAREVRAYESCQSQKTAQPSRPDSGTVRGAVSHPYWNPARLGTGPQVP